MVPCCARYGKLSRKKCSVVRLRRFLFEFPSCYPLGMLLHVFAVLQVKNKTFQRLAGGRCFPLSAREQPRKHCLKNITKDPPLISKF